MEGGCQCLQALIWQEANGSGVEAVAASFRKRLQDVDFYSKLDEQTGAPMTAEEEERMYKDAAFEEGEFFDD